jgi:hypothetical protein
VNTLNAISVTQQLHTFVPDIPKTFTSVTELRRKYPLNYVKLRDEEVLRLPPYPLTPNENWDCTVFPENFVFTLPRGRIFGRHGLGITSENEVISNTLQGWESHDLSSIFPGQMMPQLKFSNLRIAVIGLNGAASYYHWMFEVLPRLQLLLDSRIEFDKIYIPEILYPFQKTTLEKMGISENQIYEGCENTYIEASHLIIPSLITSQCCTHPMWACQFLQNTFLEKSPNESTPERKIFIVRREFTTSSRRSIINEAEIFEFLQEQGFEKVILESLTVFEQATLFANAKIVVAAHGAGLTNLVFCQPKTQVIEIFHPDHLDQTYWFLSDQLGLKHHCLQPSTDLLTPEQNENCDIYLPIESLGEILGILHHARELTDSGDSKLKTTLT